MWWRWAGRRDLTSSFKTCMWWRRHTEVSRFFSSVIEFHGILTLISFYSNLLLSGNKVTFFFVFFLQIEPILFFNSFFTFFFLRKQIYVFFFLHLLSKTQSLADEAGGAHFESELLRGAAKVVEHDVHKWNLLHFGRVDLNYCLFIALFHLRKRGNNKGAGGYWRCGCYISTHAVTLKPKPTRSSTRGIYMCKSPLSSCFPTWL